MTDKQSFPARLPLPLYGKLRQAAYDRQVSMNQIIVRALERELDHENK
jgi:predicted HicB family RNase H-like nuclease